MNRSLLYLWAGIAGIIAGLLNIVIEFLPTSIGRPLNLLVVILMVWTLTAIYLYQREESGVLGLIGYAVNEFGLALIVGLIYAQVFVLSALNADLIGELMSGTTGSAALASLIIFVLGVALFGISIIRANVFPKWAAAFYIIGFLPLAVAPFMPPIVVSSGEIVASIGILGLSYVLVWGTQNAVQARSAVAT